MSDASLNNCYGLSDGSSGNRTAKRLRHRFLTMVPYAALSVIAGIVFGTLSTHPF